MKLELVRLDVNRFSITSSSGSFVIRGTEEYAAALILELQKVVNTMQHVVPALRQDVIEGLARFY